MGTILLILATLVGVCAFVALALLMLPTDFRAAAGVHELTPFVRAQARWAWGVAAVRMTLTDGLELRILGIRVFRMRELPGPRPPEEAEAPEEEAKPKKTAGPTRQPTWRQALRLVRRLFESLDLRGRVAGRVGLGDPADTAWLYGAVQAGDLAPRLNVDELEIDWVEATFELEAEMAGRVWPIQLAAITLGEMRRWPKQGPRQQPKRVGALPAAASGEV